MSSVPHFITHDPSRNQAENVGIMPQILITYMYLSCQKLNKKIQSIQALLNRHMNCDVNASA